MVATCNRYLAKLSNSRSAIARGVWASLNAEIFNPCLGLRAKFRPWQVVCSLYWGEYACETHKVVDVDGILSATVCAMHQTRLLAYIKWDVTHN
jgi:hypothetical protein